MFDLNEKEMELLRGLKTPRKIQDFVNSLRINFEERGDTCRSPRKVLRLMKAHCIEGAILAALALRLNNWKCWLVDLKASREDFDHVIAVFKQFGKYGAISKSNHAVLRYRDPVYSSIKELVMSYFNEYCCNSRKTLRSFSIPVNLEDFDGVNWTKKHGNIWEIAGHLDKVKHTDILTREQIANLRKQDLIEQRADDLIEWTKKGKSFWASDGIRRIKFKGGDMKAVKD